MNESEKKDPLRDAIERTFAATAETRGRAAELLDEVSKRGKGAREAIGKQAHEAQEASTGAAQRVVEAVEGMRLATRDDVKDLERQVAELSKRVAELEGKPKPQVES